MKVKKRYKLTNLTDWQLSHINGAVLTLFEMDEFCSYQDAKKYNALLTKIRKELFGGIKQ